jgi:hypothetical protein
VPCKPCKPCQQAQSGRPTPATILPAQWIRLRHALPTAHLAMPSQARSHTSALQTAHLRCGLKRQQGWTAPVRLRFHYITLHYITCSTQPGVVNPIQEPTRGSLGVSSFRKSTPCICLYKHACYYGYVPLLAHMKQVPALLCRVRSAVNIHTAGHLCVCASSSVDHFNCVNPFGAASSSNPASFTSLPQTHSCTGGSSCCVSSAAELL